MMKALAVCADRKRFGVLFTLILMLAASFMPLLHSRPLLYEFGGDASAYRSLDNSFGTLSAPAASLPSEACMSLHERQEGQADVHGSPALSEGAGAYFAEIFLPAALPFSLFDGVGAVKFIRKRE